MSDLIDQAVAAAERGYFVFPIRVREREKIPLIKWKAGASREPDLIREMPWDEANLVGIACEPSGIVVVDLDTEDEDTGPSDLFVTWQGLVRAGRDDWETLDPVDVPEYDPPWVESWNDGVHIYLRAAPDMDMACSQSEVAPHVDIRGIGGIVACYADELPSVDELPPVPTWLWERNRKASEHLTPKAPPADAKYNDGEVGTRYGLAGLKAERQAIRESWERDSGDFNHTLNKSSYAVGQLVGGGELDLGEAYQGLVDLLIELGAPSDQYKTLDSGFYSGYDRPRSAEQKVLADREVESEEVEAFKARILDSGGMKTLPPPEWLVPGWLETDSLVQLVGAPGSGKSFIALDLAARLSRGLTWPDTKTRCRVGRVFYLSAEGVHGLAQRMQAWEAAHGPIGEVGFFPDAVQINTHEWDVAVEYLRSWGPALVIVDTQARCTVSVDENAFKEMSVIVDRVEKLRKLTGACVVLVHHSGKTAGAGSRGSSVMLGALTTEISVTKTRGKIKVRNSKQKNAQQADEVLFDLKSVEGGTDWVVPRFVGQASEEDLNKVGSSVYRQQATRVLKVAGGPMSVAELIEETGLKDRRSLSRALSGLVDNGLVTKQDGTRSGQRAVLFEWIQNQTSSTPGK